MLAADLRLHDARIATFGQRVEDAFKVSDREGRPLDGERAAELERILRARLDPADARPTAEPTGESR